MTRHDTARSAAEAATPAPAAEAPAKPAKSAAKAPAGKKAVKAAPAKAPVKQAAAKAEPRAAKPAKAAKPAAAPAAPATAAPRQKEKLVRDSFTMPRADFDLIDALKARAIGFQQPVKKSELLRAGLQALAALDDAALKTRLGTLTPLKAGRPKKHG